MFIEPASFLFRCSLSDKEGASVAVSGYTFSEELRTPYLINLEKIKKDVEFVRFLVSEISRDF